MEPVRTSQTPPDVDPVIPDIVDESIMPAELRAIARQRKDPRDVLLEFQVGAQIAQQVVGACVKLTKPPDWVAMGDQMYLQESGAERVKGVIGFVMPQPPECERIVVENGFAFFFQGYAGSRRLGTVDYFVGGRSSTEKFFDKFDEDGNRLPVDELLVRKAAYTNYVNRAISGLAGLRGLTIEDLKALGLDVTRCRAVAFGEGTKGGKGGAGMTNAPDSFGPAEARGKAWKDVAQEHLVWYLKAFKASVEDATKAKYKKRNQSFLDAAKAEYDRRAQEADGQKAQEKS